MNTGTRISSLKELNLKSELHDYDVLHLSAGEWIYISATCTYGALDIAERYLGIKVGNPDVISIKHNLHTRGNLSVRGRMITCGCEDTFSEFDMEGVGNAWYCPMCI